MLLRASPHPFSSLPVHPSLQADSSVPVSRPAPREFLRLVLSEAQTFLASIPETFRVHRTPRSSAPAASPVRLLTRTDPDTKDFWACRKSVHQDAAVDGSASWDEFRLGLRENHAENEMAYTPSVTAVERLLEWSSEAEIEGGWKQVHMHVNMITHTFHPTFLIAPRSFLVLAISADLSGSSSPSFVTVQIPLQGPSAREPIPLQLRQKIITSVPTNTIFASYASVELVTAHSAKVEWTMATTSNAGGAIPQWVQRSWTMGGVPKAIVSDVGLFLAWTARQRTRLRN